MAELILTEEEKKTLTYLEWDDASLGKACKKIAMIFSDDSGGRQSLAISGAAVFMIAKCLEANSELTTINVEGASSGDKQMGDWEITLRRLDQEEGNDVDASASD